MFRAWDLSTRIDDPSAEHASTRSPRPIRTSPTNPLPRYIKLTISQVGLFISRLAGYPNRGVQSLNTPRMGDVVLIDLGDGVFKGREPHTSHQLNDSF